MITTRTVFAMSACLWLTIGTAEADFVGLNIGAHSSQTVNTLNRNSSNGFDLVDDLEASNPAQTSMILVLEHSFSALPNIRYQGNNLYSVENSGASLESNNNGNAGIAGNTTTSFDLNHEDIVLYYQLLDNWVDLDMGVDLKRFDGQVSQAGATGSSIDVDETIPLLYLSARFALPLNGLYLGANINANVVDLGLSQSTAQDSTIMLGYETGTGLGIEGGIKSFSVELNDSDSLNTNLEYDGLFLNGYFNF